MQQAIPYSNGRTWGPHHSSASSPSYRTVSAASGGDGSLKRLISENPVLVVGRRGCCMCHVMKRLLLGLGVNPAICEVDEKIDEGILIEELSHDQQFPAVFIGGRLVGGLDRLMAVHISGELVPILKDAGALWL